MKKLLSLIGATGLALIMSFGFTTHQTFATSTPASVVEQVKEVTPFDASRYVVHSVVISGKVIPNQKYYYQDSTGYRGYIYLSSYSYDSRLNTTTATYAGNIHCIGNYCPIPSQIQE